VGYLHFQEGASKLKNLDIQRVIRYNYEIVDGKISDNDMCIINMWK